MRVAPINTNVALIGTDAEIKKENGFFVLNIPAAKKINIKLLMFINRLRCWNKFCKIALLLCCLMLNIWKVAACSHSQSLVCHLLILNILLD
jgi:hypothetical protein